MFRAYFDESGDSQDTAFLAMATCIAPDATWDEFNGRWSEHLAACGAPYLHMRELAHFKGAYRGWNEQQRKQLFAGCLDAVDASDIVLVGTAMKVADFRRLSEESQVQFVDPAFCCFQECLFGAQLTTNLGPPGTKVDIIYSQQESFRHKFTLLVDHVRQYSPERHNVGTLEFEDMRDVPALQLADLVSYELRKFFQTRQETQQTSLRYPFRRLCENQVANKLGMFRFIPWWQLQFQASGIWGQVRQILWDDLDMWESLLKETFVPGFTTREQLLAARRAHHEKWLWQRRERVKAALRRKPTQTAAS